MRYAVFEKDFLDMSDRKFGFNATSVKVRHIPNLLQWKKRCTFVISAILKTKMFPIFT